MSVEGKYRVDDRELLLGFYQRVFWNRLIDHIPERVTPNAITLCGQIFVAGGLVCAIVAASGPSWLWFLSAFLLFMYGTADNLDGAHARRTGQKSNLGEVLDHGLDGLANGACVLTGTLAIAMYGGWQASGVALTAVGFIFTFWEQFRTKLLVIPEVGSLEGLTATMLVCLVNGLFGNPSWFRNFDPTAMNAGTIVAAVVITGYGVALVVPLIRAARSGYSPLEVWPIPLVAGATLIPAWCGGSGLLPSLAVSVFSADLVCRFILTRQGAFPRAGVSWEHLALVLPSLMPLIAPALWVPNGWSAVVLASAVVLFGYVLGSGISRLNALSPGQ